jgi:glycosyltransferase involved in cell wall biosynthesis/predicted SAM-dependent methyltransferase
MIEKFGNRDYQTTLQGGFSSQKATGKLPNPLPNPLLLNLGCGNDVREGFINIDLFSDNFNVIGMDIRKLELPDESVDYILASDILEHFSHNDTLEVLSEWVRVLKKNAEIVVRSPSLKLQSQAYLRGDWNADIASYMIFGGQTNPGDYHCVGFDKESLTELFNKVGLELTYYEEQDIPQNQGYINLNFVAKGKKIAQESFNDDDYLSQIFDSNKKSDLQQQNDDDNSYNIALLQELVDLDNKHQTREEKIQSTPMLNIVWEGSQFVYHSLALVNREHCLNMIKADNINLTIIPYEPDKFDPKINDKYYALAQKDIRYKADDSEEVSRLPYLWVRHQWPPKFEPPRGAKWVIMQPWEFTQLRKDFAELFNQADQIWTPSNYSRQCMIESGVDYDKVQIIPNGIDPELFKPDGDIYPLNTQKKLKFLFCGGTIYRKGIDILLKAYVKAFTKSDDVCLVIKDMGGDTFYKGQTANQMIQEIRLLSDSPEIIYINEYLKEEEIAALYRSCDVFVSPYRGEGFSIPTLEAMASGKPVIVTDGGATDDFALDEFAYKIPADPISIGSNIAGFELTGEAYLLEPNQEELSNILDSIYKNPANIFSQGLIAQEYARKNWNWQKATLKMYSLIDNLYNLNLRKSAEERLTSYSDNYLVLGNAELEYQKGNYELALLIFLEIEKEKNSFNQKHYLHIQKRIAEILINLGKFNEASELIEKLKIEDKYDVYYLESLLLSLSKEDAIALEKLTYLLNEWSNYKFDTTIGFSLDDLLVMTGNIFISQTNYIDALDVYEFALKENHENAQACYGSSIALYNLNLIEQAKTMIDWAITLDPDFSEAKDFLTLINKNVGQ